MAMDSSYILVFFTDFINRKIFGPVTHILAHYTSNYGVISYKIMQCPTNASLRIFEILSLLEFLREQVCFHFKKNHLHIIPFYMKIDWKKPNRSIMTKRANKIFDVNSLTMGIYVFAPLTMSLHPLKKVTVPVGKPL